MAGVFASALASSTFLLAAEPTAVAVEAPDAEPTAPVAVAAKEEPSSATNPRANVVEKPQVARSKTVIGAVSPVAEAVSEIRFDARVDTGATTCSMHVEEWSIEGAEESMHENVGKTIRFRIKNRRGKSEWLEREIIEVATIKTSEREEQRYKVYMTLDCNQVEKRVLVSLNDRSHMTYPVLLGRNFLENDFLVDVSLNN